MSSCLAYLTFRSRLREVGTLRSLCVSEDVAPRERPRARQINDAACRAALVLLCAHMEGFFEQLINDVLAFHELNGTRIGSMPLRLRITQVWHYLALNQASIDEKKWSALQKIKTSKMIDERITCTPGTLDVELHTKGFANPGSNEVESLFATVGLFMVWEWVDKDLNTRRSYDALDALVARRHPIAHGDQGAKATPQDVLRYIIEMKRLTAAFDRIVGRWLTDTFAVADPWSLL